MPRKRSPIFQKVSNLLKVSIFIANMKKPLFPILVFLKKSSKLKLSKQHNYGYIQEYEFSPSSTPLISFHRKTSKKRGYRDLYSIFFLCQCLGNLGGKRRGNGNYQVESFPPIGDAVGRELMAGLSDSGGEEEDSVDERAERFIERFYEEMKWQRQVSTLLLEE